MITNLALGVGLAMDAFSVSVADSLREPDMNQKRKAVISGTFGLFQLAMPFIGWFLVHEMITIINVLSGFTPWISLILLLWLGIKMIREGKDGVSLDSAKPVSPKELLIQGIATSIDALSVGFTISGYEWQAALTAGIIIGAVTFILCEAALNIGHLLQGRMSGKENYFGGIILIIIGIKIFIDGVF